MYNSNYNYNVGSKVTGWITLIISIGLFVLLTIFSIISNYEFEQKYSYAWKLADKASTITLKSQLITEFVSNIESNKHEFAPYNAIFMRTKNNEFAYNFQSLKSLRDRLEQIKGMDEKDFAYQTAIQQITAQEQGEANALIGVIQGCWDLENYSVVWNWHGLLWLIFGIVLFVISLVCFSIGYDWNI